MDELDDFLHLDSESGDDHCNADPLQPVCDRLLPSVAKSLDWWRKHVLEWAEAPPLYGLSGLLQVPLPTSALSFAEKVALLSAIHDDCARGATLINPWGEFLEPGGAGYSFGQSYWGILQGDRLPALRRHWPEHRAAVELMVDEVLDRLAEESSPALLVTNTPSTGTSEESAPALIVDLKRLTVSVCGGKAQYVTSEQALRWLNVLIQNPAKWISSAELARYDPLLDGARTDKLTKYLPDVALDFIESTTGRGSRYNPSGVTSP